MIPDHAALPLDQVIEVLERDRRRQCAEDAHIMVLDERGAPVTGFEVCTRCGKIGPRAGR